MKPIKITKATDRTYFSFNGCSVKTEDVTIEIWRPDGTSMVEYPAAEVGNGKILFVWDDVIRNRKNGRYKGIIKFKNEVCKNMCIEIEIGCKCNITTYENEDKKGEC